jgi:tetratricopeptide (TPR) repeat protein
LDEAEEELEHYRQYYEGRNEQPLHLYRAQGLVEMGRGDYAAAIPFLEKVTAISSPVSEFIGFYQLGECYVLADRYDRAATTLEPLATLYSSGRLFYTIESVKLYYWLGRAYEGSGDTDRAVEQYRRFASIWANADPGDAALTDARQRLERLTTQP